MNLTDKINQEIKNAMLAREKDKLEALRAVKAALMLAKTSEGGGEVTADDEIKILQKLVKQRRETAEIYKQQQRNDLADAELFQAGIIETFLPEQLDRDAIIPFIREIISSSGASGIKDMGKVMAAASQQLAGKADNKTIAGIVKELLNP